MNSETKTGKKLFVARSLPQSCEDRASKHYDAVLNPEDIVFSGDELVTRSAGMDALLIASTEKMTADVIAALPTSIKAIATFSVGYEHIDLEATKARGIVVTNTPDVLTDATAEIALLCLLGAARRAREGELAVREDTWAAWTAHYLVGKQLTGKTLGIFGMGRIGRAVAERARGFGLKIRYSNRSRLSPALENGAVYHADPEDMLPHCHFLSLNAPASPETHHWLNAARIEMLPPEPVIVNTARGGLIHDESLIAALRNGRVFAAGLDVFEGEPRMREEYRSLPNVFAMPHIGSATEETREAMGMKCLDNLDAFFSGNPPPDRIA